MYMYIYGNIALANSTYVNACKNSKIAYYKEK